MLYVLISCSSKIPYRPNTDNGNDDVPVITDVQPILLAGNGSGNYRISDGDVTVSLSGRASMYGLCMEKLCKGHFAAEVQADKDLNYGLAVVAEKDGKPDYDNFLAITVCKENGVPLVRALDRQSGRQNVLDNTGKVKESEKEFRYTVPLDASYFSVPYRGATGRAKIIRNDISGFFHLYVGISKTIDGEEYEDWIETAQVKDWNIKGTRFFICPVVRLESDAEDEITFSDISFEEFQQADIDDNSFSAVERDFTWAGFTGDAVVVSFDSRFCPQSAGNRKFVFWSEANYVPAWHLSNELLFSYEFCETWSSFGKGCYEPMSDRLLAYSDVEILENNAVRKTVKYHYALVNPDYEAPYRDGSYPEVDEYYTLYPDGVGVREIHFIQNGTPDGNYHELSEPMVISGSSSVASDHCKTPAFVISNLSGSSYSLYPDRSQFEQVKSNVPGWGEQIYRARLSNSPDVFCVYPDPAKYPGVADLPVALDLDWHNITYQMSHFPVDKQKYLEVPSGDYSKSNALWPSQVSHSSLIGIEAKSGLDWQDNYSLDNKGRKFRIYRMLMGISAADDMDSVNGFVRSWLAPGVFSDLEGLTLTGQEYSGRETVFLSAGDGDKTICLKAEAGVRNPVFRIDGWGTSGVSVSVNGKEFVQGSDYVSAIEGDSMLIWFNAFFSGDNRIELGYE